MIKSRLGLTPAEPSNPRGQRPKNTEQENMPPRRPLGHFLSEPKHELTELSEKSGSGRPGQSEPQYLHYQSPSAERSPGNTSNGSFPPYFYQQPPRLDRSPSDSSIGSNSPHYAFDLNRSPPNIE